MVRRIIGIDREACTGCGLCAAACHEGAIGMVDGKAVLLRDDYCDGLGDCLPACPAGAISFVEREAAPYDEAAVQARKAAGCSGSAPRPVDAVETPEAALPTPAVRSRLTQWPVQLRLLPLEAPFYQGAELLIAADCTAFARADFHERFMKGRVTLIGCPKLDGEDYSLRLTALLRRSDIRSVTVVRMEVPCCGGIQRAVETALENSGRTIPFRVVTLSRDGRILD